MAKKTKSTAPAPVTASAAAELRGPRDITLAGRIFSVPPLPIRFNRECYPLCAKLTLSGLLDRIGNDGTINFTGDDIDALAELAFWGAFAGDGTLTREEFDQMPISPIELLDMFIIMRWQTGVWMPTSLQAA